MAHGVIPVGRTEADWLDRPIIPARQWVAWLAAHRELIAYLVVVGAGLLLRIWDVGSRAVHHDESLHAYYAWKFFTGAGYSYDPLMHGPLQFEVVPLFYLLFGASDFSARLLAVLLGTILVFLPFYLRTYLTRTGALLASAMLAISPAFVYFSRFIRDDIYLACFSLVLFIAIVRYLERRRPSDLYLAAVAMALAMASMEAAYLTFFIFGSFLLAQAAREAWTRGGPVTRAVRATSLDTWLTGVSIFVVITVLLYSTFFTNPYGIWDTQHSILSPERKDVWGGITYWMAQHNYHRGDQPWFYYLLVLPLYEQLALAFGAAGLIYAAMQRSLVRMFLVWWAVMAFALYTWAGEKMPWLSVHIALPLILLAGLFLGNVFTSARRWTKFLVAALFLLGLLLEIHSTFLLNFVDGANPTEMLIYVQTSNDVKTVTREIGVISQRVTGGNKLEIGLDNTDVGGWPFTWYLRDYPNVVDGTSFNRPACNGHYCPVLLLLGPEYDQNRVQLQQHYVAQQYRWNWWFPEDYKVWFPLHWGSVPSALQGHGSLTDAVFGTTSDWQHVWAWLMYRSPFGNRDARQLYFLVRRDLVPGAKYFTTGTPANSVGVAPAALLTGGANVGLLAGPRGIATDSNGDVFAADTVSHRILGFGPTGRPLVGFGSGGTSSGAFSQRDSPQDVAVGPSGLLYVTDTWNQRIEVFDKTGRYIRSWGGGPIGANPGQFYGPRSIAVAPNGHVYVADTGNKRIQVFTSTGKYLFSWGTAGSGQGQLNEPSSVAVAPDGTVYVADFWNKRIQVFDPRGSYLRQWDVSSWSPGNYDEPFLAVDRRTGHILASDPQLGRVLVFSPSGSQIEALSSTAATNPIGVAVLPNGKIAVSDPSQNHIALLAPHAVKTVNATTTKGWLVNAPTRHPGNP